MRHPPAAGLHGLEYRFNDIQVPVSMKNPVAGDSPKNMSLMALVGIRYQPRRE
jgi:hypothetical protein